MKLGKVLRKYRVTSELSLREVGGEIGISAATLMRLEQGREPEGSTLAKVLMWLCGPDDNRARSKTEGQR